MNTAAIRIAMAKVDRWELSDTVDRFGNRYYQLGDQWRRAGEFPKTHQPLPDYCNDLNAVARVKRLLTLPQLCQFIDELSRVRDNKPREPDVPWRCWMELREASDECEAILRTLNLWEGG